MPSNVDPALVEALGLDRTTASIESHGGSGFSSTYKLTGDKDGKRVKYFVKTGTGANAATMFRGEFASLNAIADAVADFCPRAHAYGEMQNRAGVHFLATDFLELGGSWGGNRAGSGLSFASKLAELHTRENTSLPDGTPFGFPVTTCCGSTEQDNSWKASWSEFYADNRLRHILAACLRNNGPDETLSESVERLASTVVPRLLGDGHLRRSSERGGGPIRPAVIHGDLWSGNHSRGRIVGSGGDTTGVEEVVYDPASVYGHSEYELGIMRMFGGFSSAFWREYTALVPKDEPVHEWEDRVALYELYHHLNHFSLFGGSYRGGAMSIVDKLLKKYG
ncbi:hypothetical protein HMPREF1624_03517 [Sporothrix schenckii ATCC 58251]|uniref:protein-ribulosamine 3-kinase n=1 Tax=Sporothrix schenckii (strain ATCC 58251 / de Perez 2211183) TaxID=1391915 RepID=U7PX25_SPOS1|nr:hypothetical protein HMPREF1624_03517 [Sporothrix schenckii ATCC 58251]